MSSFAIPNIPNWMRLQDWAKIFIGDLHPKIFAKNSNLSKCTVVTNGMLSERIKNQVYTFVTENPSVDFRISMIFYEKSVCREFHAL